MMKTTSSPFLTRPILASTPYLTALSVRTAARWVDFATAFWHVDCVRNMSLTAFAERYRKWCKRHGYNFSQSKSR